MSTAKLHTTSGTIALELFDDDAPKTVANFRKLASDHFYDGIIFHRVIRDFMIQSGCPQGRKRVGLDRPAFRVANLGQSALGRTLRDLVELALPVLLE